MPTLGRYVIERRIASGGMADVFMARMIGAYGFEKRVALKLLKPEIASEAEHVRMFVREALVAAEFRHPNLAQVYEVGQDGTNPPQLFIAMELVRGISLASMLRLLAERGGGMPMNVMLRIASDVLDGLASAHEARDANDNPLGLVHRDISPQNVMVGVDGVTKVVDFGIARAEAAFGRTIAPRVKGKFSYMAPEQWKAGGALDARADLFALGVVLYEGTTGGTKLFRGDGPKELFRAVTMEPIPPPSSRVQGYPKSLEAVVMKSLAKEPADRYESARAMRDALLEVARKERWPLGNKVVSTVLHQALGTSEIEQLWPQVREGEALEAQDPTSIEEPTNSIGQPREATAVIPLAHEKPHTSQTHAPQSSEPQRTPEDERRDEPTRNETPSAKERDRAHIVYGAAGFAMGLAAGAFAAIGLASALGK